MGLYGNRIGSLSLLVKSEEKQIIETTLINLARKMYSNPPIQGAYIVEYVLSTPRLKDLWMTEVTRIQQELQYKRKLLVEKLHKHSM